MYLYVIFIEPFLQLLKAEIQPVNITKSSHQINAFVDDVSIFLINFKDLKKLEICVTDFEQATNSRINKNKSNFLQLGAWKMESKEQETWIKSTDSLKMLGITWFPDIKTTITQNCTLPLEKIKKSLHNTFNRLLTIQQKVIFFNTFISPKFFHLAKILPIPKEYTENIQQLG